MSSTSPSSPSSDAVAALQVEGGNGHNNVAPDEDFFHDVPSDQPFFFTLAVNSAAAPDSDNSKQQGVVVGGGEEDNDDTVSSPSSSVCALPSNQQQQQQQSNNKPVVIVPPSGSPRSPASDAAVAERPEKLPASPRKRLDKKNYFFLLQQQSSKRLGKEGEEAATVEEEKSDKNPAVPTTPPRGSLLLRKRNAIRRSAAVGSGASSSSSSQGGAGAGRFLSSLNKGVRSGRGNSSRRGIKNKHNKKSSTSASSPSTTTRGTSPRFSLNHSSSNNSNNNDASSLQNDDKDILMQEPDDDPVMAVFEARSKQRVRFAVEQGNETVSDGNNGGGCFGSSNTDDGIGGDTDNIQLLGGQDHTNASITAAATASSPSTNNNNSGKNSPTTPTSTNMSIKKFMRGALFTSSFSKKNSKDSNNNKAMIDAEVQKEIETLQQDEGFWEESAAPTENTNSNSPQVLRSKNAGNGSNSSNNNNNANCWTAGRALLTSSSTTPVFKENPATRAAVIKLLNKARRAQFVYFRYEYAVKCYVKALDLLTRQDHYPQDHPVVIKTFAALNNAHHALSSFKNSASIVKMGIKYEDTGELVRALKMYTIAYRIRRDSLSPSHPSLVVLLNMLGSIQMKRGELEEAMQIFELALKDPNTTANHGSNVGGGASDNSSTTSGHDDNNNTNNNINIGQTRSVSSVDSRYSNSPFHPFDDDAPGEQGRQQRQPQQQPPEEPNGNLLARSVTYREMGTVYEKWGEMDAALHMFHKSLDCIGQAKAMQQRQFREQTPHQQQQQLTTSRRGKQQQEHNSGNDDSFEEESLLINKQDLLVLDTSISEVFASLENEEAAKAGKNKKSPESSPTRASSTSVVNQSTRTTKATGGDDGMEIVIGTSSPSSGNSTPAASPSHGKQRGGRGGSKSTTTIGDSTMPVVVMSSNNYDSFFPPELDEIIKRKKSSSGGSFGRKVASSSGGADGVGSSNKCSDYADVDAALTLHQIAQLHRTQGNFRKALAAFIVSLRGMKYCLGKNHPNVAAILGNIGNLQKEMGDMDAAFETYQQVLGIESYRLGLSHPDVAVTLHNIATIDAARGNHEHALALYRQVVSLQRKLFGPDHVSVAVTSACMGDVLERIGAMKQATDCFEEATRIKTISMGRHSLEVARLLHKLGKLALAQNDYHLADSYVSRAILIYRLNKLADDDEWMIDACRDAADVDAAIAMGKGIQFEC